MDFIMLPVDPLLSSVSAQKQENEKEQGCTELVAAVTVPVQVREVQKRTLYSISELCYCSLAPSEDRGKVWHFEMKTLR